MEARSSCGIPERSISMVPGTRPMTCQRTLFSSAVFMPSFAVNCKFFVGILYKANQNSDSWPFGWLQLATSFQNFNRRRDLLRVVPSRPYPFCLKTLNFRTFSGSKLSDHATGVYRITALDDKKR